jgi:magnesium chelatase family protein
LQQFQRIEIARAVQASELPQFKHTCEGDVHKVDLQINLVALESTRKKCVFVCGSVCGYNLSNLKPCTCSSTVVTKYQKRISGLLLDKIDIHVEVPEVDHEKLSSDRTGESSASIWERVQAARERQRVRFDGTDIVCNSDMLVVEVRKFCKLDEAGDSLVRAAMSQLNLSARGYHRVLKLARTIADLAGCHNIQSVHLAEALQYRPKEMVG